MSYKDKMKKQGLNDAELSLQIIESENDQILENIRFQNQAALEDLKNKLEREFQEFKSKLVIKDLDSISEKS